MGSKERAKTVRRDEPFFDSAVFDQRFEQASLDGRDPLGKCAGLYREIQQNHLWCLRKLAPFVPEAGEMVDYNTAPLTHLMIKEQADQAWAARPTEGDAFLAVMNEQIPIIAPVSSGNLADAFARVQEKDATVRWVFAHPRDFADFRKGDLLRILDPESRSSWLKFGLMGCLWGATVVMGTKFERGAIWVGDQKGKHWAVITVSR